MQPKPLTNQPLRLIVRLKSAATFSSGSGLPGVADLDVVQDELGLPYIRGKTLKGLLAEECESIVANLKKDHQAWVESKQRLFGAGGSRMDEAGLLHIGDARLPAALGLLLRHQLENRTPAFTAQDVATSLTGVRRQTAMNDFGGPQADTLRAMRVAIRGMVFEAELSTAAPLQPRDWMLLSASVLALRHAGAGRNRGRGWLQAELSDNLCQTYFAQFRQEVGQ